MNKSAPRPVSIHVESDSVIRLETDFADPESCLLALTALFFEIKGRHGPAAARAAARAIARPDREVDDARNAEWMSRFRDSKLSLEKFAAALAEENEKFVADKGRYSRGDNNALWSAARADATLAERGPWGSTRAGTIKRHVRNMKKKGVLGEQHLRFVPLSLIQNFPRNMKMKDVLGDRQPRYDSLSIIQNKPAAKQMAKATPRKKKSPDIR